jgi:hypothetical protein
VVKEVENKERSKGKLCIGREYQGRQIIKEYGLWTNQQAEKAISECFGAPHGKEGKASWQSPETRVKLT